MSDSPAPAPAEAPLDPGVQPPEPVRTDPPETPAEPKPEPEPRKLEPTPRDAIRRAAEKVEAQGKEPAKPVESRAEAKDKAEPAKGDAKADAKEPAKGEPARAQDGKFAPREGQEGAKAQDDAGRAPAEGANRAARDAAAPGDRAASPAPSRFADDAKAEWDKAPEPVRREVARLERELTEGLEKYRSDAKEFDSIRQFHEQVTKNGNTLHRVLSDVAAMEQAIMSDPVRGLDMVCRRLGTTLADVIEKSGGPAADQNTRQMRDTMHALSQENQRLTAIVQSLAKEQQQREQQTIHGEIDAFSANRPRFEELRGQMARLMNAGLADTLEDAYSMADRLMPAPDAPPARNPEPAKAPAPAPVAQTDRGSRSIAGAPSPGSNPAQRPRSSSIKEALQRARAAAS